MGLGVFRRRRTPGVLQLKAPVAPEARAPAGEAETDASRQHGHHSFSFAPQQPQHELADGWRAPSKGAGARWPSASSDDLASVSAYCDLDGSECGGKGAAAEVARPDCRQRFGIDFLRHALCLAHLSCWFLFRASMKACLPCRLSCQCRHAPLVLLLLPSQKARAGSSC